MSWSAGSNSDGRDVGYGVPAKCDHPRCDADIDRGLSYRCGGQYNEYGCGLFFCEKHRHRWARDGYCCTRCADRREPYDAKPDTEEWVRHKLTHPSWSFWRAENPEWVREHAEHKGAAMSHLTADELLAAR